MSRVNRQLRYVIVRIVHKIVNTAHLPDYRLPLPSLAPDLARMNLPHVLVSPSLVLARLRLRLVSQL